MRTKDALEEIKEDLKNNQFELDVHALQRMSERSITVQDILALINSAAINRPKWNSKHNSWNFTGKGFSSEDFTIACVYKKDGTLIVTVFWE